MSKFNNPGRTLGPPRPPLVMASPVVTATGPRVGSATPPTPAKPVTLPDTSSLFTGVGFNLFALLLLSGYLNDWSFRIIGNKAYLSNIALVLVPAAWLISGNALRAFRDRIGLWWLVFLVLVVLGLPFSYWRSGSLALISSYTPRCFLLFFYLVAFATDLKRCKSMMMINVISAAIVVLTCIVFGQQGEGESRFRIPNSLFFGNSNELALQLVLGITAFMFLFYLGGLWRTAVGMAGVIISFIYMLKTSSRGCLLSCLALFLVSFVFSRRKLQMIVVCVPMIALGFAIIPQSSLHRLALIFEPSNAAKISSEDMSTMESSAERRELFRRSLEYTITHPLFGVGAGQFAVALTGDAAKNGEWSAWLGTHNSYTQVSSECGIPAFICYAAVIFLTFRRTYRIYRSVAGKPEYREIEGLAFCLMVGTLVYSISTFFFHEAYTGLLPLLSGHAVALGLAVKPILEPARA